MATQLHALTMTTLISLSVYSMLMHDKHDIAFLIAVLNMDTKAPLN